MIIINIIKISKSNKKYKISFMEKEKAAEESLNKKLIYFINEHGEIAEKETGIPSKYILIVLFICIISVILGFLDIYITNLVGIVIPSIISMRTLESKIPEDNQQWLTYWVIFGIFSFIDLFSYWLLKYFPFYFILKIIFLIWLFMPNTKGAKIIYKILITKLFKKYEKQIDEIDSSHLQFNADKFSVGNKDNIIDKKINDIEDMSNNLNSENNLVNNKLNEV
jgi:receptor expression-enhancing protein 5/6